MKKMIIMALALGLAAGPVGRVCAMDDTELGYGAHEVKQRKASEYVRNIFSWPWDNNGFLKSSHPTFWSAFVGGAVWKWYLDKPYQNIAQSFGKWLAPEKVMKVGISWLKDDVAKQDFGLSTWLGSCIKDHPKMFSFACFALPAFIFYKILYQQTVACRAESLNQIACEAYVKFNALLASNDILFTHDALDKCDISLEGQDDFKEQPFKTVIGSIVTTLGQKSQKQMSCIVEQDFSTLAHSISTAKSANARLLNSQRSLEKKVSLDTRNKLKNLVTLNQFCQEPTSFYDAVKLKEDESFGDVSILYNLYFAQQKIRKVELLVQATLTAVEFAKILKGFNASQTSNQTEPCFKWIEGKPYNLNHTGQEYKDKAGTGKEYMVGSLQGAILHQVKNVASFNNKTE
ncbi:MAG: hypothetical protein H6679_05470 [Epsilonproteobacteria bacterium]|nr:hypothetical protein [Campylobacterota bacterium]